MNSRLETPPRVEYPTLETILSWYRSLQKNDATLKAFMSLPPLDDAWSAQMHSAFQTTALRPDCRQDLAESTARVFYKITKNHYRVDGNKRSAVICTVLFLVTNNAWLDMEPMDLYELSRQVAASDARKESEVIRQIKHAIQDVIGPLQT